MSDAANKTVVAPSAGMLIKHGRHLIENCPTLPFVDKGAATIEGLIQYVEHLLERSKNDARTIENLWASVHRLEKSLPLRKGEGIEPSTPRPRMGPTGHSIA